MWPCGCMVPPITPKLATGWPSLVMKPGMMVWNGRLFGRRPGWDGPWSSDEAGGRGSAARCRCRARRRPSRSRCSWTGSATPSCPRRRRCRDRSCRLASGAPGPKSCALLRIDQLGAALEVALVEQLRRRHLHEARIGDVALDVGEGELHRLDLQMRDLGPVAVMPGEVEVLEDAERHAGGDALARWAGSRAASCRDR